MANPKDIRFRKKGKVVTIRIKVGKAWLDRSGGWINIKEATGPAIAIRDKLQAEYAAAHPDLAPEPSADGERQPRKNEKSLRLLAGEDWQAYCKRQRLRDDRLGVTAMNWLWGQMGEKAELPPRLQRVTYFTKVRNALTDGPLAQSTMELYATVLCDILGRIAGLARACIGELENLPKKAGPAEAAGQPFNREHFKVMLDRIASATETAQICFWIGASGGPQIVDTVFAPFAGVTWTTGMLRYRRIKTGEWIEFRALPPLIELLNRRRERLGPDAVYILPELIFSKQELANPECNLKGWDGIEGWEKKVPKDAAVRGAGNGITLMAAFFEDCGIKTRALTYKSFRKHAISFWASIGIKLKTRMRMAGHTHESSHNRYDVPAEFEIIRASEITWRYYQSIMKGEDFFIPTTAYDLYDAMMGQWAKLPELLKAMLIEITGEQTLRLMAEIAELKTQLRAQGQQLTTITALCEKMTKHFGLD